jgi:hypothetical protein
MALYYFTQEEQTVRRATNYQARPEDGARKVVIWADKKAVDLFDRAKRRLGVTDETAQRWLARVDRLRRRS